MKIKTHKGHRHGQTVTTSEGEIEFNELGHADIEDGQFNALKKIMPDITEVKDESDEGKGKKDKGNKGGSDAGSGSSDEGSGKDDSTYKELMEMTLAELKDMASKIEGQDLDALEKMKKKSDVVDILVAEMNKAK